MDEIFLLKKNRTFGPYSIQQINLMIENYQISLLDMACLQGYSAWVELIRIPKINKERGFFIDVTGVNGQIILLYERLKISRKGVLGFLNHGLSGEKDILLRNITSIQFKNCGAITNGFIQFAFSGGKESKGGLFDATKDENTVMFKSSQQAQFKHLKKLIEHQMSFFHDQVTQPSIQQPPSNLDELVKLAELRDRGIITNEEFIVKKKRNCLGLWLLVFGFWFFQWKPVDFRSRFLKHTRIGEKFNANVQFLSKNQKPKT